MPLLPRSPCTGFSLAVLLAGVVTAAPAHVSAQDDEGRGVHPTFALDVAMKSGWPTSLIESVKLVRLGFELPFLLHRGSAWRVEAPVSLYPLAWARGVIGSRIERPTSPRATSLGIGLHPVAVRVVRAMGSAGAYASLTGGAFYFDRPVPARDATRLNFSADLEAGFRFVTAVGHINVAYVFNHISNGREGNENLALDSHMVRIAVGGG